MNHRCITFSILCLLGCSIAAAHPGIGIVMDSKGNVYYTDLKRVWKIAPNGQKTIAVRVRCIKTNGEVRVFD
ncbi:MAG TPA: hypothetical protein VJN65_01860 [Bacteroidota bacterium]|nr:hypothetical protein [Bacteroidota bacterium]